MKSNKKDKIKDGRPTLYTSEIADEICSRIVEGQTLNKICKDEKMPASRTVFTWLREKEDFQHNYIKAKQEQADFFAHEILDIADLPPDRDLNGNNSNAYIQWQKLRVDTRKWAASKFKPKMYGSDASIFAANINNEKDSLGKLVIVTSKEKY